MFKIIQLTGFFVRVEYYVLRILTVDYSSKYRDNSIFGCSY